jgi:hypothetical protein
MLKGVPFFSEDPGTAGAASFSRRWAVEPPLSPSATTVSGDCCTVTAT